uniref:Uncharacterized protein n=1 Tax=Anguilla anguilla TaxID=7936 RepID=A0A0E9WFN1_ANGAN
MLLLNHAIHGYLWGLTGSAPFTSFFFQSGKKTNKKTHFEQNKHTIPMHRPPNQRA